MLEFTGLSHFNKRVITNKKAFNSSSLKLKFNKAWIKSIQQILSHKK